MTIVGYQLNGMRSAKARMPAKAEKIAWIESQFDLIERGLSSLNNAQIGAILSVISVDAVRIGKMINIGEVDPAYKLTGELRDKYEKSKKAALTSK